MKWHRVRALMLRHLYLYRRSPPRIMEIFFWPVMDLLVWGFLYQFLAANNTFSWISYLISAMIFWDVIYRAQQGVTIAFLEDVWSRNLLNLFVAPLRRSEFVAATFLVGMIKIAAITVVLSGIAYALYHFNLLALGFALVPFFANLLLFGWAVGLFTTGLIVRWGNASEALAWGIPFLVQPFSAVFYPISALPAWLQPVAHAIPCSYVFEGMREVMRGQGFSWENFYWALALNAAYLAGAALFFNWMFALAREKGLLGKLGTQ
jgi:ABC-2 type transport system permease protein